MAFNQMKKLSIIISNRNDTTMLAVTVRSCIEELKVLGKGNSEIVICDNSDKNIYDRLDSVIPSGYIKDGTVKLIRQDFPCLFTSRETAIKHAEGEYILCLDSHMIIGHNMFDDLVRFMIKRSDDPTLGFAHAPINWAHQHERASKHDRDMTINELGNWNTKYNHERTITWKGMPWICRREWFLDRNEGLGGYGALSDNKLSWGGGDMHIGIKPWLLGFKNWAVPTSPAIHIGPFPKIDQGKDKHSVNIGPDKYRVYSASGNGPQTLGFLVSCYILGGEPMMLRNKEAITNRFGKYINVESEWTKAISLGQPERDWLLSKQITTFEQLLKDRPWDND